MEFRIRLDALAGSLASAPWSTHDEALVAHGLSGCRIPARWASLWPHSATVRELVSRELAAALPGATRTGPATRFERESPVAEGFERLTGISMDELDAELPDPDGPPDRVRERAPNADRQRADRQRADRQHADRRHAGHRHAPQPKRGRTRVLVGVLALLGLLATLLPWVSDLATDPAVAWIEVDTNLPEIGASTSRGVEDADSDIGADQDVGTRIAIASLDSAWAVLRGGRSTWLGLFPRYDPTHVARASELFEEASRYGVADATIRGEAVYGVAVTAWLTGHPELAAAALSDPAIPFSEMADNAGRMQSEVR